ncbi:MAG: pitrilysin family protein [Candidatus Eisenbacteria bacterium]|nr:pitrilysin family protein [Candidatus Eisenbacteria bacterium]
MSQRMKVLSVAGAVLLVAFLSNLVAAAEPADLTQLQYPRLHEIKIPKVERLTLKNGMTLMLVENHELPIVHLNALVKAGTVYESQGRAGLSELFSEVWRTGGTTFKTGDELDEMLESVGASVEGLVDKTSAKLEANCLVENTDAVLNIFAEILMHPAFRQDKIDLAKTHMNSGIARRNDEPMSILIREYFKLLYGATSPYARQYEYADVEKLSRNDLVEFHSHYFHPNAVILGVWGDFKASDMKKKIERAFATWNSAKIDYPSVQKVDLTCKPSVNYIQKTDIEQSFVLLGHMCMRLDDPDYPAFYIMCEILGSGWSSRIFTKVRTEKGLAYAAGGGLMADYDHPGPFYAFASTKFASTHEALATMMDEVKKITESEVTDRELQTAKDAYLNSFAFQFDSVGKIVGRLMTYEYYGYPQDFLQKTRAAIEKLTKQDVLRVAKARLYPDKLTILAVGDASRFDKPLSSFGAVSTIDITIPQLKEELPKPTEASANRAQEIMTKALAATGGAERVLSVESIRTVFKATMSTPGGDIGMDMDLTMVYPDRLRLDMQTPMGAIVQVLDKDKGWMRTPQGMVELQGSQVAELKKQIQFETITLFKAFVGGHLDVQYVGESDLDGRKVLDILITLGEGATQHLYVDANDYTIVGSMKRGNTMEGPAELTETYSDFRDVDGLKVNFASVQKAGTKPVSSTVVSEVKVNPKVDFAIFAKPQK